MSQKADLLIHFENQVKLKFNAMKHMKYELQYTSHAIPPSINLDVFTENLGGRITLRSDGICDLEVINAATSDQVVYKHYESLVVFDIPQLIEDFTISLTQ